MKQRPMGLVRATVSLVLIAAMSVAATAGLYSIMREWSFLIPAIIAAVGATAIAFAARRFELLIGETLAASIVGFVVVGWLAAGGGVPSPDAFNTFFTGITEGWADLLSAQVPAELTDELRVVPFALAWLGVLAGSEILRWIKHPGLPVIGPLAALTLTVLLTDEDRDISVVVGIALVVGALAVGLVQQAPTIISRAATPDGTTTDAVATPRRVRMAKAAAVLAIIGIAAPLVGPNLPMAESQERYDLRHQVVPPWNPLNTPSPLTQIKGALKKDREQDVVFTVESEEPIERWSLATMGAYDGIVWTVGSGFDDPQSEFRPVGPRLPEPPVVTVADQQYEATVTIDELTGPWLPTPGWGERLDFTVDEGDERPTVRENVNTGTLALPDGVAKGDTYDITALAPPSVSDETLREIDLSPPTGTIDLEALPPQVRNLTADLIEGIDSGWGQIDAIRDTLSKDGFYDKGDRTTPGHSYFRLAQFLGDPTNMVGYEEQYAAAAGLMGRIADIPTRVVVGYIVPEERYDDGSAEVRNADTAAWIEVLVDGYGWIPLDVTPPRTQTPTKDPAQAPQDQIATPNPPPPPQPPPNIDVLTENRDDEATDEEEEEDEEFSSGPVTIAGPSLTGYVAAGGGGLTLLLILFFGFVALWKARRAYKRRHAPDPPRRIAGAWRELGDRYTEAGVAMGTHATPSEAARAYLEADPNAAKAAPRLWALVGTVDRSAYHAASPVDHDADHAWEYCDEVVMAIASDRSRLRRFWMHIDPRPLFQRDSARRAKRGQHG